MSTSVGALGTKGGEEAVVTRHGSLQAAQGMCGDIHQNERGLFVHDAQCLGVSGRLPPVNVVLNLSIVQGGDEPFDEVHLVARTRVWIC